MSSRGDSIRGRISEKYEKTPGYLIYELTEAVGQEMDECDASISEVADKLNVDNLEGDDLTRFVFQRKGISRKEATFATGTVTVQGTGTVTAGDVFETENGVQQKKLRFKRQPTSRLSQKLQETEALSVLAA